ncbi:hypothetical protein IMG5_138710 [Ichthyophthirius multifiliis]|uniref:Uncharacterized protein n=1 Tax=Ichthyophthirius multifiliis TaxID=5932 RepID=G0QX68_ICHMU|nr:hypothetical protein IMG5_138710 [Ichthyophthirius multifiliis]EGR30185.1 hypothetical protein IMG5_138710 [Ichthyophthirius multifiliis]|eukprot:XP_004031759.1 hypothetical protein IMG5_138710 [Ichthyophthirius multifiliis]
MRGSSPEKEAMSVYNNIKLEFQSVYDTPENKELLLEIQVPSNLGNDYDSYVLLSSISENLEGFDKNTITIFSINSRGQQELIPLFVPTTIADIEIRTYNNDNWIFVNLYQTGVSSYPYSQSSSQFERPYLENGRLGIVKSNAQQALIFSLDIPNEQLTSIDMSLSQSANAGVYIVCNPLIKFEQNYELHSFSLLDDDMFVEVNSQNNKFTLVKVGANTTDALKKLFFRNEFSISPGLEFGNSPEIVPAFLRITMQVPSTQSNAFAIFFDGSFFINDINDEQGYNYNQIVTINDFSISTTGFKVGEKAENVQINVKFSQSQPNSIDSNNQSTKLTGAAFTMITNWEFFNSGSATKCNFNGETCSFFTFSSNKYVLICPYRSEDIFQRLTFTKIFNDLNLEQIIYL